jgi:hypothetical protein
MYFQKEISVTSYNIKKKKLLLVGVFKVNVSHRYGSEGPHPVP